MSGDPKPPDVTHAEILERMANWPSDAANSYGHALGLECRSACTAGAQALRDQVALRDELDTHKGISFSLRRDLDAAVRAFQEERTRAEAAEMVFKDTAERLLDCQQQIAALQRDQVALREQIETEKRQHQTYAATIEACTTAHAETLERLESLQRDQVALRELAERVFKRGRDVSYVEGTGDASDFLKCGWCGSTWRIEEAHNQACVWLLAKTLHERQLTACREEPKP